MRERPTAMDPTSHFRTEHLKADLRGRSVRGGAVTMGGQAFKVVLNLTSLVILARLLAPTDFGLIAMVTAIVNVLVLFQDLGLSMATIQRSEVTHAQISTLFWVNLGLAFVLTLLTMSIAPGLAWFYGEPRLTAITSLFAVGFIFVGLTVQHQALLKRQMRFSALAAIEAVAFSIAAVTGIAAALLGAGYWSLVFMQLAIHVSIAAGVWTVCAWRPGRPAWRSGVGAMLSFGGNLTGFRIANYVSRNIDDVLIGRFWGAASLGFYTRAYKLLLLPIREISGPISSVVIPALSRLQTDEARFRLYYLNAILLMAAVGMPAVVFLAVVAEDLILLLLGPQWEGVVILFQALAPAAFVGTFNTAGSWVCTPLGRTDRMLRWQIIACSIIVASFLIGAHWGALGVALAFSISTTVLRYPGLLYLLANSPVSASDVLSGIWRPTFASITAGVGLFAFRLGAPFELTPVLSLAADLSVYALLYFFIWITAPGGRAMIRDALALAKELRSGH